MNPHALAELLQRKQHAPAGSSLPLVKVLPRMSEAKAREAMQYEEWVGRQRMHPKMMPAAVSPRNPLRTFIRPRVAALAAIPLLTLSAFAADKDADNTKKNERDKSSETKTPIDQSNAAGDLELTRNIRHAVVQNKSLTMTAKNVKIITAAGHVTLRGPVKTAEEKKKIEDLATAAAGKDKVTSELEVKASDNQ
jgi:hyperosmotically inducible periplasmic protein